MKILENVRILLTASVVASCAPASGPAEGTAGVAGPQDVASVPKEPAKVDYLVFAPKAYAEELAPLLEMRKAQGHVVELKAVEDVYAARSGGKPSAEALQQEVAAVAASVTPQALHFVVLAGDPAAGPAVVPSFFNRIGDWIPGGFEHRDHRTDQGYSMFDSPAPLAVGRLPARTEAEMTTMVKKLVHYEAASNAGAWQRKVLVFGGPADFGPIADGMLEAQATSMLDQLLPYDFDLGVIFAKADSPYVYRYDQLGSKIMTELNKGSLLAVYAGHGLEDSFDRAKYRGKRYAIGSTREVESLSIETGAPIFVSLTCLTGEYGRANGKRSIAETMILNEKGPVAVFASSDISHPYPNLLYGQALMESFILKRSPTVGDAIVMAKKAMLEKSIAFASLLVPGDHDKIKQEHLTLYNLLGDPATPVRLPLQATVTAKETNVSPGGKLHVDVQSDLVSGEALATIETERVALKPGMVPSPEIEAMPVEAAFEAMAKNYEIASDKVLARQPGKLSSGKASFELVVPKEPGKYLAKVLLQGEKGVASGHVRFEVR